MFLKLVFLKKKQRVMCKISALEWVKKISVLAVLNLGFNNELLHIIFFFYKKNFLFIKTIQQYNTTTLKSKILHQFKDSKNMKLKKIKKNNLLRNKNNIIITTIIIINLSNASVHTALD